MTLPLSKTTLIIAPSLHAVCNEPRHGKDPEVENHGLQRDAKTGSTKDRGVFVLKHI